MEGWLGNLLAKSVKDKYIPVIVGRRDLWNKVFTPKSVNPDDNYEALEIVGDGVASYFFPSYFLKRFPQLNSPKGVKTVARLKIYYGSKKSFSSIADSLGFWKFIRSGPVPVNPSTRESLLEDTFEAFLGAVCTAVDDEYSIDGLGAVVAYKIMADIFDDMDISLEYTALFDTVTRLKELMDVKKDVLGGDAVYDHRGDTTVITLKGRVIGKATGAIKRDRAKEAAGQALDLLRREGHFREHDDDAVVKVAKGPAGDGLVVAQSALGGFTVSGAESGVVEGSGGTVAQALSRVVGTKRPSAVEVAGGDYKSLLKEYLESVGETDSVNYIHEGVNVTMTRKGKPVATANHLMKKVREQLASRDYYYRTVHAKGV
ncbi:RNase III [European catfish virus]|uniref:RNase III n=1 Tax=European catfish virus TaxID=84739 RepID=I2BFL4_9VIRU|nr:RNase III [European catfish virus]AFJ52317.1 RNase III [European catfish virus]AMZ04863.1 RNase III [European catfish virus]AMZ04999.1 RNase III [European catfish virus]